MTVRLPGRCRVCLADVIWSAGAWRRPGKGGHTHRCEEDRPVCGVWMPNARERCARMPHGSTGHRTAYAMANERRAKRGHL